MKKKKKVLLEKKASVKTINVEPNWVGMFDAAIANARSNKDNLGVEMLDFGKRLYIQSIASEK